VEGVFPVQSPNSDFRSESTAVPDPADVELALPFLTIRFLLLGIVFSFPVSLLGASVALAGAFLDFGGGISKC
jgi:hypothetical protein